MIRKLSRCRLLSLILLPQIGPQRIEEDLAAAGNIRSLFHEKGYEKEIEYCLILKNLTLQDFLVF